MAYHTGIAAKLRQYGVRVVEVKGWRTRGSSYFDPGGVVCHHTAGPLGSDHPSLGVVIHGRPDLSGPLCNVFLARSGTAYVVAAGRANHAGSGGWHGLSGNSSVFGIEAENNGLGERWTGPMMQSYYRTAAALTDLAGGNVNLVCAHKEWTTRKIDPTGINMDHFRATVRGVLNGDAAMAISDKDAEKIAQAVVDARVPMGGGKHWALGTVLRNIENATDPEQLWTSVWRHAKLPGTGDEDDRFPEWMLSQIHNRVGKLIELVSGGK